MQWAWRMFLAQGKTKYLDTFETILHNAYAVSLSTDGKAFFYDNTLQRREDHEQRSGYESGGELLRRAWFGCPCCPPNIIRWVAELQDHLAVAEQGSLRIANYASARIATADLGITMHTEFPWNGAVRVTVDNASPESQGLAFRVPAWAKNATLSINGEPQAVGVVEGWLEINRAFARRRCPGTQPRDGRPVPGVAPAPRRHAGLPCGDPGPDRLLPGAGRRPEGHQRPGRGCPCDAGDRKKCPTPSRGRFGALRFPFPCG